MLSSERTLHKDYYRKVKLKKVSGRGPQGAWHQDELIGGKPPLYRAAQRPRHKYLTLYTVRHCSYCMRFTAQLSGHDRKIGHYIAKLFCGVWSVATVSLNYL
jgi:hypothetical protein